jgi:hypothetical protein
MEQEPASSRPPTPPKLPKFHSNQEQLFYGTYPQFRGGYHPPTPIEYVQHHMYLPDFFLGFRVDDGTPVYLELKEYLPPKEERKYLDIAHCNPQVQLWIMIQTTSPRQLERLNQSPTIRAFQAAFCLPLDYLLQLSPHKTSTKSSASSPQK